MSIRINELKNRIEILDDEIEQLNHKRETTGLFVDEDKRLVKKIFEQMELEQELNKALERKKIKYKFIIDGEEMKTVDKRLKRYFEELRF